MTQENTNDATKENVNDISINLNENINDSESSEFSLFKLKILEAIDTILSELKRNVLM